MKNKIIVLGAVIVFSLTGYAFAHEHFNVDEKISHMKAELNLTDEQAKALKPVLEDYRDSIELAEKQKKHRLANILTDDQMKKMMDIKSHKKWDDD